jgi:hypothetical protein
MRSEGGIVRHIARLVLLSELLGRTIGMMCKSSALSSTASHKRISLYPKLVRAGIRFVTAGKKGEAFLKRQVSSFRQDFLPLRPYHHPACTKSGCYLNDVTVCIYK